MANRKLPFGYEMQRGIVCVKTAEAAVVKEIFAAYISGISYRQITDSLNAQAVPYNEPGKSWNKNMVARILSNELYTGNETYPAILSDGEYRCAASAKPSTGTPLNPNGQGKTVRQLARCAACGSALTLSGNKYGWARWNCPSCNAISADAVMPDTMRASSPVTGSTRQRRSSPGGTRDGRPAKSWLPQAAPATAPSTPSRSVWCAANAEPCTAGAYGSSGVRSLQCGAVPAGSTTAPNTAMTPPRSGRNPYRPPSLPPSTPL